MIFPNNQRIPAAQHMLPQSSTVYSYGDSVSPTTIPTNFLGMIPPTQVHPSQVLTQVTPTMTQQPQEIFKKSYLYNKNIPSDSTFCNVTTPYNYVSNQNQTRLSRVLPPPRASRINSFYRSNSNINPSITPMNSSNSISNGFSDNTLTESPSQFQYKCSTTSYPLEASILHSETKFSNNVPHTTSMTPPSTIPSMGITTPASLPSSASSPVPLQFNNVLEQEAQRRHSISITDLTNNEETNNSSIRHYSISQNSLQRDCGHNNKISKPSISNENYKYEGKLIGSSGKLLKDTKRAAQNRCAQKAFRLRHKRYIEDLKEKAEKLDKIMKENEKLKKTIELLKQDKNLILE